MSAQSLGSQQRANADRQLSKILLAGLCGSAMFHTAALAGVSYLSQNSIDDLEITAIERVEVDPDPVPTPSTQPTPAPALKIVKPIIAAVPSPVPVKIPTPKAISTPPPVVKIVKSKVAIPPPTSPLANVVSPQPNQVTKPATPVKVASKPNSPPAFPNRLFTDPTPKIERPQPASPQRTPKIDSDLSPQPIATADPQRNLSPKASTLAPTPSKLAKLAPDTTTDNQPSNDEFIPNQPGSTSKLARATDRSPAGNNQTNLAPGTKSPPGLGTDFDRTDSNPASSNDDFGSGTPGNNTRIARNSKTTNSDPNANQTGLGGNRAARNPGFGANFGEIGGSNNPSGDNDSIGGTPGNNTRIARSNGGGNGVNGTGGNQTGLGGGNRRNPSIGGSLDGNGSGNSLSGGSDELGSGVPGNIATGSKNQLSVQCLRNCEIRYPDSIEASDTGKDKILVKVSIDRNGSVTNAEIARSSGNPKLDRATLEGVKQMQLTAMGKPLTFRVKVSTLTNN